MTNREEKQKLFEKKWQETKKALLEGRDIALEIRPKRKMIEVMLTQPTYRKYYDHRTFV